MKKLIAVILISFLSTGCGAFKALENGMARSIESRQGVGNAGYYGGGGYVPSQPRKWTHKSTIEYNPHEHSSNPLMRQRGKLNPTRVQYKTRFNGRSLSTTRKVLQRTKRRPRHNFMKRRR